jgi:hypothetical protein
MHLQAAIPAGVKPAAPARPMTGAVRIAGAATTRSPVPVTTVAAVSRGFSQAVLPSCLIIHVRSTLYISRQRMLYLHAELQVELHP